MLIYVSGPYNAETPEGIENNCQIARKVAIDLWESGFSVIVPHWNTYRFELDCKLTYDQYIKGDLEIISRVDALVMLSGWGGSKGACTEWSYAMDKGIPIYYAPDYSLLIQANNEM